MLLALFLACWRWLMPSTCAIVAPPQHVLRAQMPAASRPVVRRPGHTLALIHAPPLRLLT